MALVTLSVLEGLERGRIYARLPTPVSIGREVDNTIQLNDDRVSRFHAKVQDDNGSVILTDLDSTNGTRVNGHPVQIRVLQAGDLVTIGRCVLVFGELPVGKETINAGVDVPPTAFHESLSPPSSSELDFLSPPPAAPVENERLFPLGAPALPDGLRPQHRALVSDVLAYLHSQVGEILNRAVEHASEDGTQREARCPWDAWLDLIAAQSAMTAYLKQLAEPEEAPDITP